MKVLGSTKLKQIRFLFLDTCTFVYLALFAEKRFLISLYVFAKKQMKLLSVIITSAADFIVLVKFLLGLWGQRLQHDCCGKMNTNFLSP